MSLVKTIERHCDKMVEEKQATIEMPTVKLTNTIIEAAIAGFEAQKKDIDSPNF